MYQYLAQEIRLVLGVSALVGLAFAFYRVFLAAAKRWHQIYRKRVFRLGLMGLSITASIVTVLAASSIYVYFGFGHQPDIYRKGDRNSQMVALTFDDGPSPDFTPKILDILSDHNIYATFFMVGSHVESYPTIARRVVAEGHEIGNHTYSHSNVPTLSNLALQREIYEATRAITEVTEIYPDYMRPPRGMYDGRLRRLANLLGQRLVLWTISSRDWRSGTTAEAIVRQATAKARGGDIILLHDSGALVRNEGGDRSATVKALPEIIRQLEAKGLRIVPLRVLLLGEEPDDVDPERFDLEE